MNPDPLRVSIVQSIVRRGSGHLCASLSVVDILAALFLDSPWFKFGIDGNAHFVLSKGHAAPALYTVLAARGDIPDSTLATLRRLGSPLEGHPRRKTLPAIEVTTGSLGNGISYSVGLAIGLSRQGFNHSVICVASDAEFQTGICNESLAVAIHEAAKNLVVIVDYNRWQADGPISEIIDHDIEASIRSFGITCRHINGHDRRGLATCIRAQIGLGPVCILAETKRGHGVPGLPEDEVYGEKISKDEAERLLAWCEGK